MPRERLLSSKLSSHFVDACGIEHTLAKVAKRSQISS
jgi:hypothetical protein